MNEARKENLKTMMKKNWQEAERYGYILNISKHEIYNHYLELCRKYKNHLDSNKEGLFIEKCMEEINSKRKFQEEKNKALGIKQFNLEVSSKNTIDQLKLMLWVIDKIGSLEEAEKVFNAAKAAFKVLKENDL